MTALYDAPPVDGFYDEPRQEAGQFDLYGERSVLGALIMAPADSPVVDAIRKLVKPESFYRPAHQEIAREVLVLRDAGIPIDLATLHRHFFKIRRLNAIGGPGYLTDLMTDCPGVGAGPFHAESVRDWASLRMVDDHATRLKQLANNPGTDRADIAELVQTSIRMLEAARDELPGTTRMFTDELLQGALDRIETPEATTAIPTGYKDLDEGIYLGHRPGDLIIIGARPSTGKTLVGLDLARHAAVKLRIPTLFASIEMSAEAIMNRLIAAEARVTLNRIRTGTCTDEDWARIAKRMEDIAAAPLCIDHTPKMSLAQLDQAARDVKRERGLGLIVIDYLQKMALPKAESTRLAVGNLAESLRDLGEKYGVPVISLAQLNRGPMNRAGNRPQSSDLKESGDIEAHADTIMLLHRPAQFDPESSRAGEIDVIVDKQRDGATGQVTLAFQGHYARCQSMATEWAPTGILATNGARS